jgi:hypothetical protein
VWWLVSIVLACSLSAAPSGVAAPVSGDLAPSIVAAPVGGDQLPEPPPSEEQLSPDDTSALGIAVFTPPLALIDGAQWAACELPPSAHRAVPVPPPLG